MKKNNYPNLRFIAFVACLFLTGISLKAQNVNVSATAGTTSATYTTLKGAFDAVNAGTHQGAITIDIVANTTETAPCVLNSNGAGSALYTSVLIEPVNDGLSVSGATASGRGLVELNGADNVTINGDNPNTSGTNRNLSFINTATNTTTFTSVIRLAVATSVITSADNNTVKNCIITGSATGRNASANTSTSGSEHTTYGILVGGGASTTAQTTAPGAISSVSTTIGAGGTATSFTADNNQIDACARGIAVQGSATTFANLLTVTNNIIGSAAAGTTTTVYSRGMTLQGFDNCTITGNTVRNIESFIGTAIYGIGLGEVSSSGTNALVEKNYITNVNNRSTSTFGAHGLTLTAGNAITVRNNIIAGVTHDMSGGIAFSPANNINGIRVTAGNNHKILYNSVSLYGLMTGTASSSLSSSCLTFSVTTTTGCDVRNNIFSNTITGGTTSIAHVSILLPSGGTSAMNLTLNNNAYYCGSASNQGVAHVGTSFSTIYSAANFNATAITPATNLRAYTSTLSSGGTNDNASIGSTVAAPYTSTTNLHINLGASNASDVDGKAAVISGITTDYDGDTRNATTPDIGADEFTQPVCSGTPNAGITLSSSAAVCPSTSYTVSINGVNTGSGITYQWQSSTDGITYTNIAGATSATYSATQTDTMFYQNIITCSATGLSDTSAPVQVNMTNIYACYCTPTYSNGCSSGSDAIVNVTLGTLNNNSGCPASPYYTFFNAVTVPTLIQTIPQNLSLTFGSDGSQYAGVWIDFNHDGDFNDAGEFVASNSTSAGANGTVTFSITVPVTALTGNTLMRIRGGNDSQLGNTPCGTSSSGYGETEDYIINIIPATPCSGTPVAGTIPSNVTICRGTSTTLAATGYTTGVTGISFQWEQSSDNGVTDPWAPAPGGSGATTATFTTPNIGSATYYRLKVTCAGSGLSDTTISCAITTVVCTWDVTRTTGISFNSISATGTSVTGWRNTNSTDDNLSTAQPIGFNFMYQGNTVSQFLVSTNGYITFNTGTASVGSISSSEYTYNNGQFSTVDIKTVAPFFDDLVTSGNPGTAAALSSSVKYEVSGTAPNRVLTVEWINMETYNNAGPNLNFQLKLYETSNEIEFVYGTMEGYNGTNNYTYSYSLGLSGNTLSATPTANELFTNQVANVRNFSNTAQNGLTLVPECNTMYHFFHATTGPVDPTPGAPANDEAATAVLLTVNSAPCTALCGTYYTSANATASAQAVCGGTADDDVWFTFQANNSNTSINVRGAGGYDARVQLLDASFTSLACVNATGAGLTETINSTTLTVGQMYYVRVYHNGTGSGTDGSFSICVNATPLPPANDNICGAISLNINATCVTTAGSTIAATASPQTACTGTPDDDMWYSFVATVSNPTVTLQSASGFNGVLEVMSSSNNLCSGTLTSVACVNNTSTGGTETYSPTNLTVGNTYFIRVYHAASGAGTSNFTICITATPPACPVLTAPANNTLNVPGAGTSLSWNASSGAVTYNVYLSTVKNDVTTLAGAALVSSAQSGTTYSTGALSYSSVYYWTVTATNPFGTSATCAVDSFTTAAPCAIPPVGGTATGPATGNSGTSGSYTLTGYTGTTIQWQIATAAAGPYTNIAGATAATLSYNYAAADTFYYRALLSSVGCTDDYSTVVQTIVVLAGDNVCNAIALTVGSNGPFNNQYATVQSGEPAPAGSGCNVQNGWCNSTLNNTMWFTFTAPASGRVSIATPGFDNQVALYRSASCGAVLTGGATLLAANDDGGTGNSALITGANCLVAGATYYIQVDGYSTTGTFNVDITDLGVVNTNFTGLSSTYCTNGTAATVTLVPSTSGGAFTATAGGVTGSTFNPNTATQGINDTITYTLFGCYTTKQVTLVQPKPVVNLGSNITQCGGTATLDAQNAGSAYLWNNAATSQTIVASSTGLYYVDVTNTQGCTSRDSINVTINTVPSVNLGNDTSICGTSFLLNAQNLGATYTWNNATTSQTLTATASGLYYVDVTNGAGCTNRDSINLVINSIPTVNLGTDITQCGGTATLDAQNAGSTYVWSDLSTSQMLTVNTSGTYYVDVTNPQGCTKRDSIDVTINSLPVVNLGADITQCGGTATLDAQNPGATYQWSDASSGQTLTVSTSDLYFVDVTNAAGCTKRDSINVTIKVVPTVNLGNDTSVCGGSIILDAQNLGSTYVWNDLSTSSILFVSASGTYYVDVTNAQGCTGTDTIDVAIVTPPAVNLGNDIVQCGGTATLDAQNAGSGYVWNDASTGQTLVVSASGTYYVEVTAAPGCTGADTISVTINPIPVVTFALPSDSICLGASPVILSGGAPANGTYSGTSVSAGSFDPSVGVGAYVITYTYTDANSCSASATQTMTVEGCTGLDQSKELNGIALYPNPTYGNFFLELKGLEGKVITQLYTPEGKLMYADQLNAATTRHNISIAHLPNGVYYVKLTSGSAVKTIKLVKTE